MDDLPALAAKQEIRDQLYRYCRAMDRMDVPLGYAVWHEDGTADYGPDMFVGRACDFIDHVTRQHAGLLTHSHQITNILVEVAGDVAASEAYVTATLHLERDGQLLQLMVQSRYLDRWSCRAGRWAIDHRIAIVDLDEIRPITALAKHRGGSRDADDPSYALFTGLIAARGTHG